jgi:hypothetical protein
MLNVVVDYELDQSLIFDGLYIDSPCFDVEELKGHNKYNYKLNKISLDKGNGIHCFKKLAVKI